MTDDVNLKENWQTLLMFLKQNLGKKPVDLNGVLFIIGVQELGKGKKFFTKEEKQDLMHIAICKVLSYGGYYVLDGVDAEGWPHWKLIKPLPNFDLLAQENLLKHFVIEYFRTEVGLHI
ncbi:MULTISPECIES: hypothetical protein [Emticicia]|uniref:hypothetical protein n=1 Tax=Emticicia TaxID=312278 RepID=UPI000C771910|nr:MULTISPECIES: hypothetical protein [Emticicia]PLK46415.1 hypothetical protein C0V77_03470 [Emticicia sp. TH156]UTA68207.1 hypothetical protein MB380_21815 [Emticicia sp. 21SJ11W-3]